MILICLTHKNNNKIDSNNNNINLEKILNILKNSKIEYKLYTDNQNLKKIGSIKNYNAILIFNDWIYSDKIINIIARANQKSIPIYNNIHLLLNNLNKN